MAKILPDIISESALRGGLYTVVTQAEIQRMWGKGQKTVDWARLRGKLDCRKSGKVWLITVASAVALWGQPLDSMTFGIEDSGDTRLEGGE